jgi:hypothetical protein
MISSGIRAQRRRVCISAIPLWDSNFLLARHCFPWCHWFRPLSCCGVWLTTIAFAPRGVIGRSCRGNPSNLSYLSASASLAARLRIGWWDTLVITWRLCWSEQVYSSTSKAIRKYVLYWILDKMHVVRDGKAVFSVCKTLAKAWHLPIQYRRIRPLSLSGLTGDLKLSLERSIAILVHYTNGRIGCRCTGRLIGLHTFAFLQADRFEYTLLQ